MIQLGPTFGFARSRTSRTPPSVLLRLVFSEVRVPLSEHAGVYERGGGGRRRRDGDDDLRMAAASFGEDDVEPVEGEKAKGGEGSGGRRRKERLKVLKIIPSETFSSPLIQTWPSAHGPVCLLWSDTPPARCHGSSHPYRFQGKNLCEKP